MCNGFETAAYLKGVADDARSKVRTKHNESAEQQQSPSPDAIAGSLGGKSN